MVSSTARTGNHKARTTPHRVAKLCINKLADLKYTTHQQPTAKSSSIAVGNVPLSHANGLDDEYSCHGKPTRHVSRRPAQLKSLAVRSRNQGQPDFIHGPAHLVRNYRQAVANSSIEGCPAPVAAVKRCCRCEHVPSCRLPTSCHVRELAQVSTAYLCFGEEKYQNDSRVHTYWRARTGPFKKKKKWKLTRRGQKDQWDVTVAALAPSSSRRPCGRCRYQNYLFVLSPSCTSSPLHLPSSLLPRITFA